MKKIALSFALLMLLGGTSCARHVTLDPELVRQKNSRDWTVKSEPAAGAEAGRTATSDTTVPNASP